MGPDMQEVVGGAKRVFRSFWQDDRGMELVEYAVMVALIVAALITVLGTLSGGIADRFDATEQVLVGE